MARPGNGIQVGPIVATLGTLGGEAIELTLTLPAAHRMSGRLVDESGVGIPDVWVHATGGSPYAAVRPLAPVLTDAEGSFTFTGFLPGRYQLSTRSGQGEAKVDDVPSDRSSVTLRMRANGSLAGKVESSAGEGVSRFLVAYNRVENGMGGEVQGSHGVWSAQSLVPGAHAAPSSTLGKCLRMRRLC